MSQSRSQSETGKLYIVGTGPGSVDMLTERAKAAILESEYVIGNRMYIDLLEGTLEDKKVIMSSMGKEVDRAKKAVELAKEHIVSMVSGGDAGVYGMASIVLEVMERSGVNVPYEVIAGVTAATAAASRLGSPLSSDFMVISLSDLLTPWPLIEKRIGLALEMNVPLVLYNPKSKTRKAHFKETMEKALTKLPKSTPVGIVKNAYREGEIAKITDLGSLAEDDTFVDMHSTVIIGNSESRVWKEGDDVRGIITPRGYDRKYVY